MLEWDIHLAICLNVMKFSMKIDFSLFSREAAAKSKWNLQIFSKIKWFNFMHETRRIFSTWLMRSSRLHLIVASSELSRHDQVGERRQEMSLNFSGESVSSPPHSIMTPTLLQKWIHNFNSTKKERTKGALSSLCSCIDEIFFSDSFYPPLLAFVSRANNDFFFSFSLARLFLRVFFSLLILFLLLPCKGSWKISFVLAQTRLSIISMYTIYGGIWMVFTCRRRRLCKKKTAKCCCSAVSKKTINHFLIMPSCEFSVSLFTSFRNEFMIQFAFGSALALLRRCLCNSFCAVAILQYCNSLGQCFYAFQMSCAKFFLQLFAFFLAASNWHVSRLNVTCRRDNMA